MELVVKSFSTRNNSVEDPVLPYDLEELREFIEPELVGFWVNRHLKMQKSSATNVVCVFELPL